MQKLIFTIILSMLASSAFAGSCAMMTKYIDAKIEEAQKLQRIEPRHLKNFYHIKKKILWKYLGLCMVFQSQ